MEDWTPLFFGLQIDEILGIKKAGGIGSVIGTPHLAGALRHLGKRAKHDSGLVRDADTLVRPSAGRKRAAHPKRAFIQVRQKFGADHAAEGEVNRHDKPEHAHSDRERTPADGPTNRAAIPFRQEVHDWVMPFLRSFRERETCQHGCDQNREDQRPEQRKGDRPGHGMEQAAFDALQREDGQVRGDDDSDRVEHRALDFVRGLADSFALAFASRS